MEQLSEIYVLLKEYGYCKDQGEFSRKFLKRSEGYYAYIKSSKAPICLVSLALLTVSLHSIASEINPSRDFVKRQRLRSAWCAAKMYC